MLSILPLWITLNTYAFLLEALSFAGGTGAWKLFSFGHPAWGCAAVVPTVVFLFAAIRIHCTYPAKLRAFRTLYQRNRESLHLASFHDFMGSPCYRLLVRTVLARLRHPEKYDVVFKAAWGSALPWCSRMPATVVVFKNPEEGRRWLESRKMYKNAEDESSIPSSVQNKA